MENGQTFLFTQMKRPNVRRGEQVGYCSHLSRDSPWFRALKTPGAQNTIFSANCNCRIGTVPLIELIVPNAPPPAVGIELFPAAAQLL